MNANISIDALSWMEWNFGLISVCDFEMAPWTDIGIMNWWKNCRKKNWWNGGRAGCGWMIGGCTADDRE